MTKITPIDLIQNITKIMEEATTNEYTKGCRWYTNAGLIAKGMGAEYGATEEQVCGVIAALSPQTEWHRNLTIAERFLDGERQGIHTAANVDKAERILTECDRDIIAAILFGKGGRKVESFFYNLLGDGYCVTIDRHAFDLAVTSHPNDWKTLTPNRHAQLVLAYVDVAKTYGLQPCQVQAITWLTWRRLKGYVNTEASWHGSEEDV